MLNIKTTEFEGNFSFGFQEAFLHPVIPLISATMHGCLYEKNSNTYNKQAALTIEQLLAYDITTCTRKDSVSACDALRNLVPFIQFGKREKHPWRGFTFSNWYA